MKFPAFIFLLLLYVPLQAQKTDVPDTLKTVIVQAYASRERIWQVAAPVHVVQEKQLRVGNELSFVHALNRLPGVNMEQRSPGSYRINIRGSTQRAPFGVRNVKVYYQGIPMTDPGGNTYLQILGPYNAGTIEVIKGPSGSLYGSGTGGVLLIRDEPENSGLTFSGIYGSKHTYNILVSGNRVSEKGSLQIKYNRQSSDGYRNHTAMHRDVIAVNGTLKSEKNWKLSTHFLYGKLYYQTPGGLTYEQYLKDPMAARPGSGSSPSAEEAKAAFHLNYVLAGIRLQQHISDSWENEVVVYGAYGQNRNPNTRNYSRTSEPHAGARINFHYAKKNTPLHFTADAGAEFQTGWYGQRVFHNNAGTTGELITDDEIKTTQAFAYVQGRLRFRKGWMVTAGSSLNFLSIDFQRFSGNGYRHHRNFNGLWMPRLAISKSMGKNTMLYGAVSRGFSPPSTSELLPSTNVFDTRLQAEMGTNYELGWRKEARSNRLFMDVNIFHYKLKNTIIQQRDSTGGDYFINAGSTSQNGIEALARYMLLPQPTPVFKQVSMFLSATIHDFRFKDYQPEGKDYSGNLLPGSNPLKLAAAMDITFRNGITIQASSVYRDRVMLNDGNTAYAPAYLVLHLRAEYAFRKMGTWNVRCFAGSENITNATYSLGNDINAFGGRYYNAAPGRTIFVGIKVNAFQK